ncbi:MAG: pirin family protein [Holophagales bacterium]|nr:MAG: pirin family protein [Holophagales bacterium]
MILLRRSDERRHERRRRLEAWHTFPAASATAALADGFGVLTSLDEHRLAPGAAIPRHSRHSAEVVTYVRQGTLVREDSTGVSSLVRAGEFHRMSVGPDLRHHEVNPSPTASTHVFQLWLRPVGSAIGSDPEQKRFSTAERRHGLCVVASPDLRRGSLRLDQEVLIFSALLGPGQHLIHPLATDRSAWLHLVAGAVTFDELILDAGDGAAITAERSVSMTAREESEILLLDLPAPQRVVGESRRVAATTLPDGLRDHDERVDDRLDRLDGTGGST